MQGPALDGLAEHNVAGADRKSRPDEVPDEVTHPVVARVLPIVRIVSLAQAGTGRYAAWVCLRRRSRCPRNDDTAKASRSLPWPLSTLR
jgi:hypothetical protein